MSSQDRFIEKVLEMGADVGLGLDLGTKPSLIDLSISPKLDVVLVMCVPAGFGGQKFDESAMEVIEELARIRDKEKLDFKIHADGGITQENISDLAKLGVDEVSVGRRLFEGDLKTNIEKFLGAC